MKKYAMGGMMRREREPMAERIRARREDGPVRARPLPETEPVYKKGGKVKSGGSFRKAADGVASKGKTKGKMIKMRMGGKC